MGCHPGGPGKGAPSGTHNISFYCDDIEKTVTELKSRGVEFTDEITDRGYGLVTHFKMPGDFEVQLYQPRYTKQLRMPEQEASRMIHATSSSGSPKRTSLRSMASPGPWASLSAISPSAGIRFS